MTTTLPDFDMLIREVRAGSQDAAWQLIENYSSKILRVVRRELPDTLRKKFDSQDFLQVVWASVFREPQRLTGFDSPDQLAAFLGGIAANKVKMEKRRRFHGQKHNVNLERALEDSEAKAGSTIQTNEPSPEQIAIARERWERMMDELSDDYKKIVELRLAGNSVREIAQILGKHEGTVHRAIRKIEQMCQEI